MNLAVYLDGSDAAGRQASTQSQRIAAFKKQLSGAILLLDSLNPSSLNDLKQDEVCKAFVLRLLSIYPDLTLSRISGQIDQVVKAGLEGIAANITRLSLRADTSSHEVDSRKLRANVQLPVPRPASMRVSSPIASTAPKSTADAGVTRPQLIQGGSGRHLGLKLSSTLNDVQTAATPIPSSTAPKKKQVPVVPDDPERVATIYFVQGGWEGDLKTVIHNIEDSTLSVTGHTASKYSLRQSTRGSIQKSHISLISSPSTDSLHLLIESVLRDRRSRVFGTTAKLWTTDAITVVRKGGTVEYGIRIVDKHTNSLFMEQFSTIRHQVNNKYICAKPVGWWGQPDISVTDELARGIYLLSGDVERLKALFEEGVKTIDLAVTHSDLRGVRWEIFDVTNHYVVDIRPFRLCDQA